MEYSSHNNQRFARFKRNYSWMLANGHRHPPMKDPPYFDFSPDFQTATTYNFRGTRLQEKHPRSEITVNIAGEFVTVRDNSRILRSPTELRSNFKNIYPGSTHVTVKSSGMVGTTAEIARPGSYAIRDVFSAMPTARKQIPLKKVTKNYGACLKHTSAASVTKVNQNQEANDQDDVVYLFTVDCTPNGQIVQEIDLSSETEGNLMSRGSSKESTNRSKATFQKPARTMSTRSTKKQAAFGKDEGTRKRKAETMDISNKRLSKDTFHLRCTNCYTHYDALVRRLGGMYISASCGHLFCRPCIRKDGLICGTCNSEMVQFRKVYL